MHPSRLLFFPRGEHADRSSKDIEFRTKLTWESCELTEISIRFSNKAVLDGSWMMFDNTQIKKSGLRFKWSAIGLGCAILCNDANIMTTSIRCDARDATV